MNLDLEAKTAPITIRNVTEIELQRLWEISYGPKADLTWKNFDGPYFNDPILSWEEYKEGFGCRFLNDTNGGVIFFENEMVGVVTAYFEDGKLKRWLEFGIAIYHPHNWNKGIGSKAADLWIKHLFQRYPEIERVGYTTWSGNDRMMALGEKIGMKKEAQIRKVRYWQGQFWDSMKYGILREEVKFGEKVFSNV
ncbi:GNAT family N-acetyltransferase [Enterococcus dispar]|uniref:GNAT family N-acetyltransferase n=1 Tax=Enterococcus dispar TaxID=44009 RepID=UPI002491DEF5|nr:GNAT family protein [Enterococcus dispar]